MKKSFYIILCLLTTYSLTSSAKRHCLLPFIENQSLKDNVFMYLTENAVANVKCNGILKEYPKQLKKLASNYGVVVHLLGETIDSDFEVAKRNYELIKKNYAKNVNEKAQSSDSLGIWGTTVAFPMELLSRNCPFVKYKKKELSFLYRERKSKVFGINMNKRTSIESCQEIGFVLGLNGVRLIQENGYNLMLQPNEKLLRDSELVPRSLLQN